MREHEDRNRAQRQQREQSPKGPFQNRERPKCLGIFDLGGDAHVGIGQPFPGSRDLDAAIVAIAVDVDARVAGDGVGRHPRQRQVAPPHGRTVTLRHVAARIADHELQNRMRIVLVRQQSQENQRVVEAAVGNEQSVLVEGIRLAGIADAAQLQDPRKLQLRSNAQARAQPRLENSRRESAHRRTSSARPCGAGRSHPSMPPCSEMASRHRSRPRGRASGTNRTPEYLAARSVRATSPRRSASTYRRRGSEYSRGPREPERAFYRAAPGAARPTFHLSRACRCSDAESSSSWYTRCRRSTPLASDSAFDRCDVEPGFEHRGLDVEQCLQLRPQTVLPSC